MAIDGIIQTIKGSFAIEDQELDHEDISRGKDILTDKRTVEECIAELDKQYGIKRAEA